MTAAIRIRKSRVLVITVQIYEVIMFLVRDNHNKRNPKIQIVPE
jgi:hypothetical protein